MLVTSVLLALALAGAAVVGYLDARLSSEAVIRSRAFDTLASTRRSLRLLGPPSTETALDLVDDMADEGLRYLAIVDGLGRVHTEAGRPSLPMPTTERLAALQQAPDIAIGPRLVQVVDRLKRTARPRQLARLRRRSGARGMDDFLQGWERWHKMGDRYVVIEFEPEVARSIERRALTNLLLSLAATALLLVGAFVFWRQWWREDEFEALMAADAHLKKLGEMAAILGHEIRNPLASLKGHAQLLTTKLDEGPSRKKAELVVDEAVRIERLTQQILDFARTGSLQLETTDLHQVLAAAADGVGDRRVVLPTPDGAEPCPLLLQLDRMRLEQVFTNLFRNGLGGGEGDVTVTVARTTDGGAVVEVRDRGPGVPADEREAIFEPFHTGRLQGTGLGLTVARRIVEGHGGTIVVTDADGGGALFRVTLPGGGGRTGP